jgi:mRNA-degrading endonuclease RelE of RelBE toxin-antitoxin system
LPTRVIVEDQVREYQRALSPEPRRRLKAAMLALARGQGDTKPLQGNLEGLSRLRVGEHRIIYRQKAGRVEVFYAAPRSVVYEFLAAHLAEFVGRSGP